MQLQLVRCALFLARAMRTAGPQRRQTLVDITNLTIEDEERFFACRTRLNFEQLGSMRQD